MVVNESVLREGLEQLGGADIEAELMAGLDQFIRTATDGELFRVNPIRFGIQHGVEDSEAIDLFLHASVARLFRMEWDIVCSSCGNVFKSFRKLEKVDPHFHCTLCDMENTSTLDDVIQVVFTVEPKVRSIVFHDPDSLTLEQLLYEYHYSTDARTHVDGEATIDYLRDLTIALQYIEPRETLVIDVDLEEGSLLIRDWTTSLSFFVGVPEESSQKSYSIAIGSDGLEYGGIPTTRVPIETPVGTLLLPAVHAVGPGEVHLSCTNSTSEPRPLWVVKYPAMFLTDVLGRIESSGPLTAKQLLHHPTFRKLFGWETPGADGGGLAVTDLTYLFTDLKGSTAMYDKIGDANAYSLVRTHFSLIDDIATDHHGVVVKTIGDAVMATFVRPVDAVASALEMVARVSDETSEDLILKVGVHRGFSMAVTLNGQLDYFGQNVNIAARTQQQAGASEVLVTKDVLDSDGVSELIAGAEVKEASSDMKGVTEEISVFRITV